MVNQRALTAAMIDSREFLAARRRADTEVHAPAGARIAFTGGTDCNDVDRIWTPSTRSAPWRPLPIGVVVFPGSGISAILADKARKLGIPVWRFTKPVPAETGEGA
jgi:hypothetical protein